MVAVRLPIAGVLVALSLLVAETIGAIAYRDHAVTAHEGEVALAAESDAALVGQERRAALREHVERMRAKVQRARELLDQLERARCRYHRAQLRQQLDEVLRPDRAESAVLADLVREGARHD